MTARIAQSSANQAGYDCPFQVFYGVSANRRSAWSIANARGIFGHHLLDDSKVTYADETDTPRLAYRHREHTL